MTYVMRPTRTIRWLCAALLCLCPFYTHAMTDEDLFPTSWSNPVTEQPVALPDGWLEYGLFAEERSVTFGNGDGSQSVALGFDPADGTPWTQYVAEVERHARQTWAAQGPWRKQTISNVEVLATAGRFLATGQPMYYALWKGSGVRWRLVIMHQAKTVPDPAHFPIVADIVRSTHP